MDLLAPVKHLGVFGYSWNLEEYKMNLENPEASHNWGFLS